MASNNKIFAFVGCGCLGIIVVGIAAVFMIGAGVFGLLKNSEPYTESLNRAQNSPAVTAALGTPIKPGFFVTGNVSFENSNGEATISYSISGPSGKGTVTVDGDKQGDVWSYSEMSVSIPGSSEKVDLLTGP